MRRAILLFVALLLGGCYEVSAPLLTDGVRAEAVKDGRWRRADGSELVLRWDADRRAYGVAQGGMVRLAPLGPLWLADYQAARDVVLLARIEPDRVVLYAPTPAAEKRLAAAHNLAVKPGPVYRLVGDPAETRHFLAALAASGELVEAERLEWIGPL